MSLIVLLASLLSAGSDDARRVEAWTAAEPDDQIFDSGSSADQPEPDASPRISSRRMFAQPGQLLPQPEKQPLPQRGEGQAPSAAPALQYAEPSGWLSGWTEISYTASTDSSRQLPMGFNDKANQFLLQQNWLRLDRPADADRESFGLGYHSDTILPGSDYRFTLPRGLWNRQLTARHGGPNLYGIDPVQFYAEAYLPGVAQGMNVKLGRFYAPWGVENVDAPRNALLSRAYTFVYDPFTQTGLLTTTRLNERVTVQAGIVCGSDIFISPADQPTFTGSLLFAPPGARRTLRFATIFGSARYSPRFAQNNLNIFDMIYTNRLTNKLTHTYTMLYGYQSNVPQIGFANWLGVTSYLTWQFCQRVAATTRLELFDDAQGQRTQFKGLYTAWTNGLQFRPSQRLLIRPEVRFDYNGVSRPFENHHGLLTATADVILFW